MVFLIYETLINVECEVTLYFSIIVIVTKREIYSDIYVVSKSELLVTRK